MFLITVPGIKYNTIREVASAFKVEVYSPTSLSVERPATVGQIARYLCKVGKCFEVQPWE